MCSRRSGLTESPFMPVFAPPQRMFVRGRGTELFDVDGQRYLDFLSGIAVTSLGHANPAVAAAISAQAVRTAPRQQLLRQPAGDRRGGRRRRIAGRSHRTTGTSVLRQQRRRGDRVRHQAGPQARRAWTPHRRQRLRQLPRPHARRPRGNRSAEQARAVPTDAGRVPARGVGRRRRRRGGGRRNGGRRPRRADPRRRRRASGSCRLSRGDPPRVRRGRRLDDRRRDPDGDGPHRPLVRLRARRRGAGRRHPGEGARQRHAGRGVLGPRRRGRRVRAGRPRQHVQRHGDRYRGRQRRDHRDAPHRRPRCRQPSRANAWRPGSLRCRASRRCAAAACCWPPSSTVDRRATSPANCSTRPRRSTPSRRRRCAWPRRSPSATTRSTRPSTILGEVLG